MSNLLKDIMNNEYIQKLANDIKAVYSEFEADKFATSIMDETWDSLELKARWRHITLNLGKFLPSDYEQAIGIINQAITSQVYGSWAGSDGFCMFYPDFIEIYGQSEEHWDISMAALALYTPYATSEFAVRPFIINHEERMMEQMYTWAKSENEHLRRLASEGCRPALPWAQALPKFKQDPAPILPILEQLKADPSAYVRKSVANNLNDISKTHPDLVAKIAKEWYGKTEDTDWIVKHACRTLLKKGNRDVLAIFGFNDADAVTSSGFAIDAQPVAIGGAINFSFFIAAKETTKVRLEYAIDFVKANDKLSRKIFQISESTLKAVENKAYTKNHSFADLSTRKHYPGTHSVTLIVNGIEQGTLEFELTK